jgi:hypothetical protein
MVLGTLLELQRKLRPGSESTITRKTHGFREDRRPADFAAAGEQVGDAQGYLWYV